jgi:hypothetical protein
MEREKFVLVTASQEPNIGVINIGTQQGFGEVGEKLIKEKLPIVLGEHFDANVKLKSLDVKSVMPIMIEAVVEFTDEPEVEPFIVEMSETWVY